MRYLEAENPYVICRFTTGDTCTIDIYDLADNSKDVDAASMTEIGTTGYFKYYFNPSISSFMEYLYIASNSIEEHAGKLILGGYPDSILDDTGDLQGNQGNWATAVGFAVPNEYDTELMAIQTDVAGLNGDGMRGTNSVPTNPLLTNDARLNNLDATISSRSDENPPSQVLNDYKADVSGLPTAATVADQVWDESTYGHMATDTFGAKNQRRVPSETLGDYWGLTAAQENKIDAIQTDLDSPDQFKADVSGLPTASENAAAVWTAVLATFEASGNAADAVVRLIKNAWNKKVLTKDSTTQYTEVLFDDNTTTPIRTHVLTKDGNTETRE